MSERIPDKNEPLPLAWREALRQIRVNLDAGGWSVSNRDFLQEHGGALLDKVEEVLEALPSATAPTVSHAEAVRRAHYANAGIWPSQLESGVMFYLGERITREEFTALSRPSASTDGGTDNGR